MKPLLIEWIDKEFDSIDRKILKDFIETPYFSVIKKFIRILDTSLIWESHKMSQSYEELQAFRLARRKLYQLLKLLKTYSKNENIVSSDKE